MADRTIGYSDLSAVVVEHAYSRSLRRINNSAVDRDFARAIVVNRVACSTHTRVNDVAGVYCKIALVSNGIAGPVLTHTRRPCIFIAHDIGDFPILPITAVRNHKRSLVQNGLGCSCTLNDSCDGFPI